MKFGRNLPRNQVPEWASAYINYKGLKKLIKTAAERAKRGEGTDTAGIIFLMAPSYVRPEPLLIPPRVLLYTGSWP